MNDILISKRPFFLGILFLVVNSTILFFGVHYVVYCIIAMVLVNVLMYVAYSSLARMVKQQAKEINSLREANSPDKQHDNLVVKQVREKETAKELETAKRIQQSLVPTSFPNDEHISIESVFEPSRMVGGDFYDHFPIDDNRFAIVIGDVSGKGIPAALHMAEIKGIFQSLRQLSLQPKQLIFEVNKAVSACFEKNIFVTLVYIIVDRSKKLLTYVRAGHCPLLIFNGIKKQAYYLDDEGLGLGIIRDNTYENHIFVYDKEYYAGDVLLLYTDGLDEATDPYTGTAFGHQRLKESLEKAVKEAPNNIKNSVLGDLRRYVKDNENLDDLAMLVLKFS